jgi:hypothetical protein
MGTTVVTGYYGSGKTEFCVNLALSYGEGVTIADLDVINPYFRSREKAHELATQGITIMGDSLGNNSGQDLPAVSFGFLSAVRRGENVIIDLGGGLTGANLLAACRDALLASSYEFLCVLNLFRQETDSHRKMVDFVEGIFGKSGISVTGLVNNGHMLHHTTAEHVLASQNEVMEAAKILNLPLKYTLLKREIYEAVSCRIASEKVLIFDKLQMREEWQ